MGHPGFNRQWAREPEQERRQRGPGRRGGLGGPGGDWSMAGGPGWQGRQGPPPWVAGLFGLDQGEPRRGPRVRRGDVRSAILDVLRSAGEAGEPLNGYQVISEIAERSGGEWKPSPGSVYPTISQLQDEGLIVADDERGRRTLSLSAQGLAYVVDHAGELAAVWAPFERKARSRAGSPYGDLKPEIGQLMGAVWQIVTSGSPSQQQAAIEVLIDTRRRLYGILADGDATGEDEES